VLQSRVSQVITAMAPETLERLVTLERPAAERRRFLLDVSQSMAVDAVLDLVGAAATATSRSLSPALLQLLGKLAEYSEQGVPETRGRAEFAFRTQIRQLIEGWDEWDRRDPSPADHQRTMDNLRLAGKSPLRGASSTYECEPERLLMMSLEVGVAGPSASAAASWLITQGRTGVLRDLLAQAPHRELGPDILRHAASGKVLAELLQREPLDGSALDLVIPLLGDAALEPLMDALARAESAETRDHLVRLLVPFGDGAAARAWARMESSSWPAQRNLLSLLIRLPSLPPGFTPALFLDHPDAPVRTDALRMLFRGAATRSRAICDALASGDPAIVRMAVFASVEDCPPAAAPLLVGLMVRPDGEPGVRSAAISAAASVSQPAVVEALLSLCYVPGRWFRRPRIAGKSPVVLAALAGLARHWSEHARVKPVLALAAGHPDDDIRAAADRKPR
jgi:hypothetical protein